MPQKRNKKILIYIFLFLIIGTFNNKYLNNIIFSKIDKILINGIDDTKNLSLVEKLNFLRFKNLFFISKDEIVQILDQYNYIENYSIFKIYPSTLSIEISETEFLAYTEKDNKFFFLGSNGKMIKTKKMTQTLPFIFGKFKTSEFLELKDIIDNTNLSYFDIKNLFYFKSGRWDIETHSGFLIKLPKTEIKEALEMFIKMSTNKDKFNINIIDLRQTNQVIISD